MKHTRRTFLARAIGASVAGLAVAGYSLAAHNIDAVRKIRVDRDEDYWKDLVSRPAWKVLFEEDTERPFSSPLNDEKREGTFVCAACYQPLFKSEWKYDSGTGWPSFYEMLDDRIGFKRDFKLVWPRKEYHCARCGGHQGHVFDDGPKPTGLRYCNNGLALTFIPKDEPLPPLRG